MLTPMQLKQLRQDIQFSSCLGAKQHQTTLFFHSTWGIFSPREIDDGTQLLLKYLKIAADDDCFDLGCGYGAIGLFMAKNAPQGQTLMVDKDFMAIEYSNKNCQLNAISNATAMLSNGFQQIPSDRCFDVIASNVPAKVGKEMMSLMLHDAYRHLKTDGQLYLVTINGLRHYMKRNLKAVFGNFKKVKQSNKYTISYAKKT